MSLVISARRVGLSMVPGHQEVGGVDRLLLMTSAELPGASFHAAAHVVAHADGASEGFWRYAALETHPFDEINFLLPGPVGLTYQYEVAGRTFRVEAPATVIIRAGEPHRMEAIAGSGTFLCLYSDRQPAREELTR
jgi:mannose-6-phosphate isomerase-like protein (cupin superfamily)